MLLYETETLYLILMEDKSIVSLQFSFNFLIVKFLVFKENLDVLWFPVVYFVRLKVTVQIFLIKVWNDSLDIIALLE